MKIREYYQLIQVLFFFCVGTSHCVYFLLIGEKSVFTLYWLGEKSRR